MESVSHGPLTHVIAVKAVESAWCRLRLANGSPSAHAHSDTHPEANRRDPAPWRHPPIASVRGRDAARSALPGDLGETRQPPHRYGYEELALDVGFALAAWRGWRTLRKRRIAKKRETGDRP